MSSDADRDARRLRDIVDNIDAIEGYVERLDFTTFAKDRLRIDAVERCLQRITEAAIRVGPDRLHEIAPAVPLNEVRGLGNMLRHEYDKLDLRTIWSTVRDDLPGLRAACEQALRSENRG